MTKQDKTLSTMPGLSSLLRAQFSPGLLLEDDDLNTCVTYTRELNRLLFRSLFGCGVICGLTVSGKQVCAGKWEFTVSKGLALDCFGNPIELPSDVTIDYAPECGDFQPPVWLAVCYAEKCCRPKEVTCSQDDDSAPRPTRIRSGYEVKLYGSLPKCACHCPTDDDKPVKQPASKCCEETQDSTVSARTTATDPNSEICPCYQPHFNGECECGCNCCCVLVGKIRDIPTVDKSNKPIPMDNRQADVDDTMVRRIRPILNGYFRCKPPAKRRVGQPGDTPGQPGYSETLTTGETGTAAENPATDGTAAYTGLPTQAGDTGATGATQN